MGEVQRAWRRLSLEDRVERRPHRRLAKNGRLDVGSPEKEIWGHFEETWQTGGNRTTRTGRKEVMTQVSEGSA